MNLLDGLNEQQKEAVLCIDGPILVLAGAGSGKTKTLTHRIAHLINDKGVSPYHILAVTFTNKASKEMQIRVARLLDKYHNEGGLSGAGLLKLPWLGTFHSICVRILRREADFVGYSRSFTIYDDQDQMSVIKRIMKELSINPKNFNPNSVSYFISGAKNELMEPEEYKKYVNSPFEGVVHKVYEKYQKYLKAANAMDFDDLIMQCVKLFQQNPKILEKYQQLFKYILIDEYQDTNEAQYVWVKLLAMKHKNIMVVGDDYQSIYSWRGANFRNILNFEKDYKEAKVIKLEQNYRSTKTILAAANEVIKHNKNKKDKVLWTENPEGIPILVYEALNEKDEAEFVAAEIKACVHKGGNFDDFAVLYRTNAQSRAVEETFLRYKVPYKIVGGVRFYDRKEIKDIVAYLRLLANPSDFQALERAIQVPARGIGEKTIEKIRELSIVDFQLSENSPFPIPKKVQDFFELLQKLWQESKTAPLDKLVIDIAEKTGYKNYLLDGTAEGEGRWENIQELAGVAEQVQKNYEAMAMNQAEIDDFENSAFEMLLEQIALVSDTDNNELNQDVVTMMTMHSAKGLEFDNVFIVGAEEGLFPHSRALMDMSEMEEERRLCYVGITRAKKRLYIIHATERNLYGQFQCNPKSRFIEDIPDHLMDEL